MTATTHTREDEMTHTPTPWKQYEKTPYEYAIHGGIGTIAESVIAAVQFGLEADTSAQQRQSAQANAAFIVRACNAHEELVSILQKLSSLAPSSEGLGGHAPLSAFIQLASDARKALTSIEQGA